MSNTDLNMGDLVDSDDNFDMNKAIDQINENLKIITNDDVNMNKDEENDNSVINKLKKIVSDDEAIVTELNNKIDVLTNKIANLNNTKKILDDMFIQLTNDIVNKNKKINEIKEKKSDDIKQSPLMIQLISSKKERKQEQKQERRMSNKQIPIDRNIAKPVGKITHTGLMVIASRKFR